MTIIKLFKYELIKTLVFLFLFLISLFYVLSIQDNYYGRENTENGNPIKSNLIKNVKEHKQFKN